MQANQTFASTLVVWLAEMIKKSIKQRSINVPFIINALTLSFVLGKTGATAAHFTAYDILVIYCMIVFANLKHFQYIVKVIFRLAFDSARLRATDSLKIICNVL